MTTIVAPSALSSSISAMIPALVADVEVAGRLVCEHDRGSPDKGARDRNALALTAGELRRPGLQPVAEPDSA